MSRITRRLGAVLVAVLLLGACGSDQDTFSITEGNGSSVSSTAPTTTSSDPTDYVTQEEFDAFKNALDDRLAGLERDIKKWVKDGFVSDDELEALIDEQFATLVDEAGFLTQDEIDEIVQQMVDAGMSEETVDKIIVTLTPTDGPVQGIAGENPCTNRAITDENQLLLDLGRELKLADTRWSKPVWRQSFADWQESDLQSVAVLWNEVVGNPDHEFTLEESGLARVYWCAGTDADGTTRSGVWRHQLTLPIGKVLYDFGNGVAVQKDCHNLTVFISKDRPKPPPGVPTTTTQPTPTTAPTTTIPGDTTTTAPTTTVPVVTTTSLKPPVNTTPAPATTAAPAIPTPPATSPSTIPTPPEVTDPEPVDTVVDATIPAEAPPVCIPGLPAGVPGGCNT